MVLCTYEKLYIVVTITSVISLIIGIMNFALKTDFMTGGFGLITLGLIGSVIIILKSLYIKLEAPNEVTLNREENPQLFKVIDSAIEMTKAPKLDEICILDDENIGVTCLLNGFGANGKNVLVIRGQVNMGRYKYNEEEKEINKVFKLNQAKSYRLKEHYSKANKQLDNCISLSEQLLKELG